MFKILSSYRTLMKICSFIIKHHYNSHKTSTADNRPPMTSRQAGWKRPASNGGRRPYCFSDSLLFSTLQESRKIKLYKIDIHFDTCRCHLHTHALKWHLATGYKSEPDPCVIKFFCRIQNFVFCIQKGFEKRMVRPCVLFFYSSWRWHCRAPRFE